MKQQASQEVIPEVHGIQAYENAPGASSQFDDPEIWLSQSRLHALASVPDGVMPVARMEVILFSELSQFVNRIVSSLKPAGWSASISNDSSTIPYPVGEIFNSLVNSHAELLQDLRALLAKAAEAPLPLVRACALDAVVRVAEQRVAESMARKVIASLHGAVSGAARKSCQLAAVTSGDSGEAPAGQPQPELRGSRGKVKSRNCQEYIDSRSQIMENFGFSKGQRSNRERRTGADRRQWPPGLSQALHLVERCLLVEPTPNCPESWLNDLRKAIDASAPLVRQEFAQFQAGQEGEPVPDAMPPQLFPDDRKNRPGALAPLCPFSGESGQDDQ